MPRRKKSKQPSLLNGGCPPRIRRGLPPVTEIRCPDCELMGNLDAVGRPLKVGAVPLRGSRASKWRPSKTAGCETCNGSGSIAVLRPNDYDTGRGTQQFKAGA